jgi:putative colanic acid biosynthesis acetyltransferase WcaF
MIKVEAYKECLPWKNKIKRAIWNVTCLFLFRPFVGPLFWRWRNLILCLWGAQIGRGSKVQASVHIWAPWNLVIGDYTAIGSHANCYNPAPIKLASKVVISQGAYLCTASHDISNPENPLLTSTIVIDSFAWVAADAFVGMGVTIGQGAVVGARAAVFKDVDPWTVVGGNPAKFIKKRIIKE